MALLRLGAARRLTQAVRGLMYNEPHNPTVQYDM